MTELPQIRHLDICHPLFGEHAFVSSASGLIRLGDLMCVVADDAHYLAIFPLNSPMPGQLIRLLPDDLPEDAVARKAVKPDFEILLQLPDDPNVQGFRLLAMGSGSTEHRMRGAIIELSPDGVEAVVRILDLRPLFTAFALLCPAINLEGATVYGDRLILFNRGNMEAPVTGIYSTNLPALLVGSAADIKLEREIQLPSIRGVPLSVTDACRLDDGTTLLSTVAEETGDAYADGAILAAAFVVLDDKFDVMRIDRIESSTKIEGIAAQRRAQEISLFCVSDADDPNRPSSLYMATLRN